MSRIRIRLMSPRAKEIGNGTTIGNNQMSVSPFITENLSKQTVGAAARLPFITLISTHHFFHIRLLHQILECRQICFPQIPGSYVFCIEFMSGRFRSAMNCKMFGTCMKLVISIFRRPLQSVNDSLPHSAGQERIFSISFLSSSPTWVTKDIDIRSPYCQSLIPSKLLLRRSLAIFPSCLITCCIEHFIK